MTKKDARWNQTIEAIEKMEQELAYTPGKYQKFIATIDADEIQLILDALATHKGVIRMRMQQETKVCMDLEAIREANRKAFKEAQ